MRLEFFAKAYEMGLYYWNLAYLAVATTRDTNLPTLALQMNRRGHDALGLCGNALLEATRFNPQAIIPAGTVMPYPSACGGLPVESFPQYALTAVAVIASVSGAAFLLYLDENRACPDEVSTVPVRGPLTQILRYRGVKVPKNAQDESSQGFEVFARKVNHAAAKQIVDPQELDPRVVTAKVNSVEGVIGGATKPVQFEYFAIGRLLYLIPKTVVEITGSILFLIRMATGAKGVQVMTFDPEKGPDAIELEF